jgi:hypothetical protein
MTRYPPMYQQEGVYPAQLDRLFLSDATSGNASLLSSTTAFTVTQHAGTAGMSVDVAAGRATVLGSDTANQGTYIIWSDAVENPPIATAPGTGQSRIDLIVAQVRDDFVNAGGNNDFQIVSVTGTAAATGSQVAPAAPASSLVLAQVAVGPLVTSILNANITDVRPKRLTTAHFSYAMRYDRSTSLTMSATPNTAIVVPCQNKIFDQTNNAYNTTTGLYTCPVGGLYSVTCQLGWNMAQSGGYVITVYLYKNGVALRANSITQGSNPGYAEPQISTHDVANAGDTYAMYAQHSVASAVGLRGTNETSISIAYLGAA